MSYLIFWPNHTSYLTGIGTLWYRWSKIHYKTSIYHSQLTKLLHAKISYCTMFTKCKIVKNNNNEAKGENTCYFVSKKCSHRQEVRAVLFRKACSNFVNWLWYSKTEKTCLVVMLTEPQLGYIPWYLKIKQGTMKVSFSVQISWEPRQSHQFLQDI